MKALFIILIAQFAFKGLKQIDPGDENFTFPRDSPYRFKNNVISPNLFLRIDIHYFDSKFVSCMTHSSE
jgi:hypothetical protein